MLKKIIKFTKLFIKNPLKTFFSIVTKLFCIVRSYYYSKKFIDGNGRILIAKPCLKVQIRKPKSSKFIVNGTLKINPHLDGEEPIKILLGKNSHLQIDGDFTIGNGVKISLSENAILNIGGQLNESGSGITANTLIMVNKRVDIGKDFLCAWNVFITDSDWHTIKGQNHQKDVIIGDHVWIANNNNILKGTCIGDNCIVASSSKLTNCQFGCNLLIAGIPGRIVKEGISWYRDI